MQAKIFLSSFLATLLAVGVIATPIVEPRIVPDIGNALKSVGNAITAIGDSIPRPKDPVTTPKINDALIALASLTGVGARDLVSSKPSSVNLA